MQPVSESTSGTKQLASSSTTIPAAAAAQQIVEMQHTLQKPALTKTQIQTAACCTTGPTCYQNTDTDHCMYHIGRPVTNTLIQSIMPRMHDKQGGQEQESQGWYHQE